MKLYMLDTDIASYIIKGNHEKLITLFSTHIEKVCISSITAGELYFGAMKKKNAGLMAKVDAFCNLIPVINWTDEAAKVYGNIRVNLELQGMPLASMDLLIAASAVSERAVLVTNNMAHFSRVPKLQLVNWLD